MAEPTNLLEFISPSDLDAALRADVRAAIIKPDELDTVIRETTQEVIDLLKRKYDTFEIFSQRGDLRHASVVKYLAKWIAYDIHARYGQRTMPAIREEGGKEAKEFFRTIALPDDHKDALISVDLPKLQATTGRVFLGSGAGPYPSRF
jgi:hypothetical protein